MLTMEQRLAALDLHMRLRGPFTGLYQVGDAFFVMWARETERWGFREPPRNEGFMSLTT